MMRKGEKKRGRPASYEEREPMPRVVGVRLDAEAREALAKIEAAVKAAGILSPRSVAIRRALIETAARLDAMSWKDGGG